MTEESVLGRLGEAIGHSQRGERDAARAALIGLWQEVGPDGAALHRCGIAHALADVQDSVGEELEWDRRALAAAGGVTDADTAAAGMAGGASALLPSLHLNLADGYLRDGARDRAREHLNLGRDNLGALAEDGYRAMIRDGLDRVATELDAETGVEVNTPTA
jgi:hypothetical protein